MSCFSYLSLHGMAIFSDPHRRVRGCKFKEIIYVGGLTYKDVFSVDRFFVYQSIVIDFLTTLQ